LHRQWLRPGRIPGLPEEKGPGLFQEGVYVRLSGSRNSSTREAWNCKRRS
jgi:hypothetical protein